MIDLGEPVLAVTREEVFGLRSGECLGLGLPAAREFDPREFKPELG